LKRRAILLASLAWPARAGAQDFTFALPDGSGHLITPAQFRGRYLLVFFGYTRCPDLCPTTLRNIAVALAGIDPAGRHFAAAFISLDAAHDRPANVARYAALFSPRITGLTGSPAQLHQAIIAFHAYAAWPQGPDGPLQHSALLYLLSPTGTLADILPAGLTAPALARRLARLPLQAFAR
jgi:protein SCO1